MEEGAGLQEEKEKILNSNAHKYFWLYVVVFFMIATVMILFSSFSQERLKMEKEQISEQLTEEKNFSKGIQKTAYMSSNRSYLLLVVEQNIPLLLAA